MNIKSTSSSASSVSSVSAGKSNKNGAVSTPNVTALTNQPIVPESNASKDASQASTSKESTSGFQKLVVLEVLQRYHVVAEGELEVTLPLRMWYHPSSSFSDSGRISTGLQGLKQVLVRSNGSMMISSEVRDVETGVEMTKQTKVTGDKHLLAEGEIDLSLTVEGSLTDEPPFDPANPRVIHEKTKTTITGQGKVAMLVKGDVEVEE